MKKLQLVQFLLAIFLTTSLSTTIAQDSSDDSKPAKIGVRAGWQYAGMYSGGDQLNGTSSSNSFYIGVFKEKKLAPLFRLGSGLEYLQNGYNLSDNMTRDIHYISVPLYLKAKLGPLYATCGTGFNFKIKEELPGTAILDPLDNKSTDVFDMPFQLGAGVKILMISIEARYNWGMLKVNNGATNEYLQIGGTISF